MINIKLIKTLIKNLRTIYKRGDIVHVNVTSSSAHCLLKDKVALVTGGTRGIGFAIAKKFVSEGAIVVITGRDEETLKNSVKKLSSSMVHYVVWDAVDFDSYKKNVSSLVEKFGDIDILVNNAGQYKPSDFLTCDVKTWESLYRTNSESTFFMCQVFCRLWLKTQGGKTRKIINISSQGGFTTANNAYRMTKWDIRGLTEWLGYSYSKNGIIVNGIAPGIIMTDMQPKYVEFPDNYYTADNPTRRLGLPIEIAELALFLASDVSNFIVGQTILCDGGYTLKY